MARTIAARTRIALLVYSTLNIILFTAAVYAVTMFPPLEHNAGFWLAVFTAASLIVTAPVAWCVGACLPEEWRRKIIADPSPLANAPTRPV
jgi:hypothetical protein